MTQPQTHANLPPLDLHWELGRLLRYIANVATAIRRNSAYNDESQFRNPQEVALDVMWLSDSLHGLGKLAHAIQTADRNAIANACDELLAYYRMITEGAPGLKGDPKATFERHATTCNPREALAIFTEIRASASASPA